MKVITTIKSFHSLYMDEQKKKYLPDMDVEIVNSPKEIAERIGLQTNYIEYIDIVTFWNYLKNRMCL